MKTQWLFRMIGILVVMLASTPVLAKNAHWGWGMSSVCGGMGGPNLLAMTMGLIFWALLIALMIAALTLMIKRIRKT